MKNWTIGRRLTVGFGALALLSAVLSGVFLFTLGRIDTHVRAISSDNIPGLVASNTILKDVLNYRVLTLRHVASQSVEEMRQIDE